MKTTSHILCLAALIVITSCNQQKEPEFNPQLIRDEVMRIDSVNRVLIAERSDSIPVIMNPETGYPYSEQEIRDSWLKVSRYWKKFVFYVRRHHYDKASQFLLDAENRASILGHLRDSQLRSEFILDVVKDLLYEYQSDNYIKGYLEWLYDEVLTEVTINGITNGLPHNVAATFPQLLLDYGITLSDAGYLDNALELVPIYYQAMLYFFPEDELWPLFQQTFFKSAIYHVYDDFATRDSIIQDFRNNILPAYGDRSKEYEKNIEEIEAFWAKQESEEYGH